MRDTLRKAKPQSLADLIALNALYRPGPLRGGVVDDFIARKHGRVEIKYEVPALEPVLRETYGVIAYQEQVMRIASDLAGFSMGEADILRKAMGKKNAPVMQAQRQRFVEGATARRIPLKKAEKIFDLMEYFAGYGFNKSHSTTYALLAYQTAYLKANYPWHFMAALLTIESQNTDKLALYLGECRDLAIPILQPDVNASDLAFTVTKAGVRFGLGAVKNVGEGAIASILEVRAKRGVIESLYTLCEEADLRLVNKRVLESLVKAGALDSLVANGRIGTGSPAGIRARLRSLPQAEAMAGEQHPAILATLHLVDAAGFSVKSAEGALLPQLSANAGISENFREESGGNADVLNSSDFNSTSAGVGLQLTVPIYQGGRTSAIVRQSKESLGQARIEVDVSRDQVRSAVSSAWAQYKAALEGVSANREQVSAQQLALNGVIEERNVGQRTTLDVLNAQSDVITAQSNLATSERDAVVASYAILSAVGRLSTNTLGLRVTEYRPEEHYKAVKDKWFGLRTPDGR